jgi:ABC-type histidine transport system ATPase subunit
MILVTHDMGFARTVAGRAIFLHLGKVEEEGSVDDVFGATKSARLSQFLNAGRHP